MAASCFLCGDLTESGVLSKC